MGQISIQIPQAGQPNLTEDPKVSSALLAIATAINGNLDATNLSTGAVPILASTGTARALAFGSVVLNFLSGSPSSDVHTVAHGIGRVPVAYTGLVETTSSSAPFVLQTSQIADATNLYLYGASSVNAGSNFSIKAYWLAIG